MWRHMVILNVSIGGSREGKTGGGLLEMNKPPFSAYLHPPMLSIKSAQQGAGYTQMQVHIMHVIMTG